MTKPVLVQSNVSSFQLINLLAAIMPPYQLSNKTQRPQNKTKKGKNPQFYPKPFNLGRLTGGVLILPASEMNALG